jgi:LuxR family maltose regulon positive regulatory protein
MYGMREAELMAWARTLSAGGIAEPVRERLESYLQNLTEQGLHGSAMEIRALLAVLYHLGGRIDRAVAILGPALTLAAREGHVRVFLDEGRPLVPVLRQAAAQGVESNYVAKLLDAFRSEGLIGGDKKQETQTALADPLSDREVEVLRLVAAGLSNPEIAEHLFLSTGTVKRHVYNIFMKLDATSRVNAISRARDAGIL